MSLVRRAAGPLQAAAWPWQAGGESAWAGRARAGGARQRHLARRQPACLVPPVRSHRDRARAASWPGNHGAERTAGRQPDVEHLFLVPGVLFAPLTLLFGPQATLTTLLTLGFAVAGGLHCSGRPAPLALSAGASAAGPEPAEPVLLAGGWGCRRSPGVRPGSGLRRPAHRRPRPGGKPPPWAPHPGHRAYRPAAHAGRSDHADPGHSGRNLTARYLTDLWLGTKGAAAPSTAALRSTLAYWHPSAVVAVTSPGSRLGRYLRNVLGRPALRDRACWPGGRCGRPGRPVAPPGALKGYGRPRAR